MPGIGVHDHGKHPRDHAAVRQGQHAADGPSARPGADGRDREGLSGSAAARRACLRQGLRRPRRHDLGNRDRDTVAAATRGRLPPAYPAHADLGQRRSDPPGQGGRSARDVRDQSVGAVPRLRLGAIERLGSYALSYWVPEKNLPSLLGRPRRRHHRHRRHRPRAAYARGKGDRLAGRVEGAYRHAVDPVLRQHGSDRGARGQDPARARGRRLLDAAGAASSGSRRRATCCPAITPTWCWSTRPGI